MSSDETPEFPGDARPDLGSAPSAAAAPIETAPLEAAPIETAPRVSKRTPEPRRWKLAERASTLAVALVGVLYLIIWVVDNSPLLFDPALQNSDARTSIFPFHRYANPPQLTDDPIADEMLALVPIGVRFLYRITVPFTDVFIAPKIIQGFALAILLWAAWVLARSKRAGIAAAVLVTFLVLHDWFAIYRVAGGLPRAFAFPLFALWLAGALTEKPWTRRIATVLAALTYPSAMNMLLAAEGLYTLRGAGKNAFRVLPRRLLKYGALVGVCVLCALPAVVGGDDRGPIHTLEQAKLEPAFGKSGRLWILPFEKPTDALGDAFIDSMRPRGTALVAPLQNVAKIDADIAALAAVALVLSLCLLRVAPAPWIALCVTAGSVILYGLSRAFAFRLYSPERYYSYGMRMAAIALFAVVLSQSFYWLRGSRRATARNLLVLGFVLGVWGVLGSGIVRDNGMTISQRYDAPLYEFIARLPQSIRIASHPMDGDGIPYYSARRTMGAFETLQPWFTKSWAAQKARAEETLTAFYTSEPETLFAYAEKHGVTHLLVNKQRYGKDYVKKSGSFDPFTGYAKKLLAGSDQEDLLLASVPKRAIVFSFRHWQLVDVARLEHELASSP